VKKKHVFKDKLSYANTIFSGEKNERNKTENTNQERIQFKKCSTHSHSKYYESRQYLSVSLFIFTTGCFRYSSPKKHESRALPKLFLLAIQLATGNRADSTTPRTSMATTLLFVRRAKREICRTSQPKSHLTTPGTG